MTPAVQDVSHLPAIPIKAKCKCGARTLPVWQVTDALSALRKEILGMLPNDTPILTYRCRHCKTTVAITAEMLHLTEPKEAA